MTGLPIHPLLAERHSPRAFDPRAIEGEKLAVMFEAARWAPSCYNDQPWYFIVAQRNQGDAWQRALDCLVPFNQTWAATAPVLLICVTRLNFSHNGNANRHSVYDLGLAMGCLLIEGMHQGIFVHQMAGFDVARTRSEFAVPEGFDVVAMAALGYRGDSSVLPQGVEEKDPKLRERKPNAEFVFDGRWSTPMRWS